MIINSTSTIRCAVLAREDQSNPWLLYWWTLQKVGPHISTSWITITKLSSQLLPQTDWPLPHQWKMTLVKSRTPLQAGSRWLFSSQCLPSSWAMTNMNRRRHSALPKSNYLTIYIRQCKERSESTIDVNVRQAMWSTLSITQWPFTSKLELVALSFTTQYISTEFQQPCKQ